MQITRCEGSVEEYTKRHEASGFRVGDLVFISRAPLTHEGGWGSYFLEDMKHHVGNKYRILSDEGGRGFRLITNESHGQGDKNLWCWPYFVLDNTEMVNDADDKKHTTCTKTKQTNKMTPFIFHSPRTISKKAYTLVGVLDETKVIATMHIGLSVCSDSDILNKKIGIAVATGRAKKAPLLILQLTLDEQKQSLQKFLRFAETFTPSFVLHTKLKLEFKL